MGALVQLALNVVLANAMGAGGLGTYHLFVAWTRLSASTSNLGLPPYNLRHVSALRAVGRYEDARGITARSVGVASAVGASIAALGVVGPEALVEAFAGNAQVAFVVRWALVAGALFTLQRILAATLTAMGHANLALSLEFSALPVGMVLIGGGFLWAGTALPPQVAITIHVVLLAASVMAAWGFWRRGNPRSAAQADHRFDRGSLRDLWLLNIVNMALTSAPMILLPRFAAEAGDLGHFGVAQRLVGISAMMLTALAAVFSPGFARHQESGDGRALRRDLVLSMLLSVGLYLPLFFVFVTFPEAILALFGAEFAEGAAILIVLGLGQFANAATGLAGQLLAMTGWESGAFAVTLVTLGILVAGAFVLGNSEGALGVAIATASAMAFRNVALLALAFRATAVLSPDAP